MTNIRKVIDELANAAITLEFELAQETVSQPRTAALKRLVAVHRKELNAELTALAADVPKLERTPKDATKAKSTARRSALNPDNTADQQPSDMDDGKNHPGKQPSDVPTE